MAQMQITVDGSFALVHCSVARCLREVARYDKAINAAINFMDTSFIHINGGHRILSRDNITTLAEVLI